MRVFLTSLALAACGLAAGAQSDFTSPHKVAWGWGCGGNCAVNFSGESTISLRIGSADVRLEDHGTLIRRQNDPSGTTVTTRRWHYAFHGKETGDAEGRELALRTDVSECTRMEVFLVEGKPASKTVPCPGAPKRWKLVCARRQVEVKGQPRQAWVCSPPAPMDAFGSEFPWVFGIEAPITTVISGEPRPHTRYE